MGLEGGSGSSAGKTNDIRAGGAFVELWLKSAEFNAALAKAKTSVLALGSFFGKFGLLTAAVGGAIVTPILALTKSSAESGDAIAKMAKRTGLTVGALSELGFAAEQSGSDLDALEKGLTNMNRVLGKADDEGKNAQHALARLGLTVNDVLAKNPDDRFELLADRVAKVADPTLRAGIAMSIMGKSASGLLPLLSEGADGISALRKEAHDLGLSKSPESAAAAERFQDALNRLNRTFKAMKGTIGNVLIEPMTTWFGLLKNAAQLTLGWIKENKQAVTVAFSFGAALLAIGTSVALLSKSLGLIAAPWTIFIGPLLKLLSGGAVAAFGALAGVIGAVLSPLGLLLAGLAGIGAAWLTMTDRGKRFGSAVGEVFETIGSVARQNFLDVWEVAKDAWSGIVAAVSKGDLEMAFKIAGQTLKVGWLGIVAFFTEQWQNFVNTFGDGLKAMATGLAALQTMQNALATDVAKGLVKSSQTDWMFLLSPSLGALSKFALGGTNASPADILANLQEDKARRSAEIIDQLERNLQRFSGGGGGLAQARAELEKELADLQRMTNEARQKAEKAEKTKPNALPEKALFDAVRGAFQSPDWRRQFGAGESVAQKQLVVAGQQLEVQKNIEKAFRELSPAFK